MRSFQLKIHLMVVFVLSWGANVLAQETSVGQSSASSRGAMPRALESAADVIEVETEIGVEQMKPSNQIDKPTIKPRSDYNSLKGTLPRAQEKTPSVSGSTTTMPGAQQEISSISDRSGTLPRAQEKSRPLDVGQPPVETISDAQIVEMSASLRKLIEDNNKLKSQIADLDGQLKTARGQQKLESNRVNEVVLERDALKKQNENIVSLGNQAQKRLETLQADLTQKEQDYSLQIVRLQTELAQALRKNAAEQPAAISMDVMPQAQESMPRVQEETPSISDRRATMLRAQEPSVSVNLVSAPTAEEAQERGQKILLALDAMSIEKNKITFDEAKVHYNMGNTYFNQGSYAKAAKEYIRSLELSPQDASAHYNLAFVSGEFLNDPQTALDHYKRYLFFNPDAEDTEMIRQKIIEAEIQVKGDVHFESGLNEELRAKKNDVNAMLVK